jgi:hypothetical protein
MSIRGFFKTDMGITCQNIIFHFFKALLYDFSVISFLIKKFLYRM